MKKKYKIMVMIGVIAIAIVLSIWMYIRPEALGNINLTCSEPVTSISTITFQGEAEDNTKFSLSSNIKNGDLDD